MRWGLYPWFEEHGLDLIHPDDLAAVRSNPPGNRLFEATGESDGWLRLRSGESEFRALPLLFREIEGVLRAPGTEVELRDGRRGCVTEIRWHFKRELPLYHLSIAGRPSNRRFWESDFV